MNVFWKAMTIFTTDEVKSTQLVLFNKATSMLEMKEIINRTASFVIQMNRKKRRNEIFAKNDRGVIGYADTTMITHDYASH